uniref:C2H2-type domain-containing protein n=1 Tax=Scophthalmus maximus TaxID=52904 RepID=A0A8D2ZLZ7_SCOMX
MADNEDDSGPIGTIPEPPAATCTQSPDRPEPADHNGRPADSSQTVFGAGSEESGESLPSGSGAQLADFLQRCPEEQSILVGTELTALGPDLVNTTIIYVQPDGSLVEGSGLTAEEQQALLEQLTRQQLVQVSDTEATQLLQQSQLVKTIPVHNAALDPSQLQQVINQVTKSKQQVHVQVPQQQVQVHQQNPKTTNQNNASQQLKSVAQQVAMQTGSVQQVQKKSEPVRIQIKVPPKQEVKPSIALQQKNVCVNHPQVKLSANGSLSSAQIIHIQPVIGQQGQQFFLQQSPGDPPIQLLLQSPAPVVGSLLPLVHKLTGPTTSKASGPGQKPAAPPSTFKTVATSIIKTLPTSTPASVPLIEPINGMTTAARKSPAKAEEKKKLRKREKKMAKVQTRSGRVSRPPKYKAKDYKFIKTEDLADSHQSDSDDYSDMSEEEEGVRKDGPAPGSSSSLTYSHKSRSHRCQTCDKAYIGPGGLNRHYKLNPTHGDPDPPGNRPDNTPRPLGDVSHSQETTVTEEKPAAMATNRVTVGLVSRRGRRGRPPKISVTTVTSEQQVDRRRDRLRELVEQCEDEELMDIVLPRLTKVLSLWELLLAKVECGGTARTRFPDIYREYESLQVQVKQAAQDYIISPQGGATSTSAKTPSTEALPPDTPMEVCPCEGPLQTEAQVEPLPADQDQVLSTPDIAAQTKEPQEALGSSPKTATDTKAPDSVSAQTPGATETSTVQTLASQLQQRDSSQSESSTTDACEAKELQEGQEIYIQTEGLTVQLAEPGSDRIVIVNGPDGTTMHIQTPDGVPLEAVQALLGIEASDGNKVPH